MALAMIAPRPLIDTDLNFFGRVLYNLLSDEIRAQWPAQGVGAYTRASVGELTWEFFAMDGGTVELDMIQGFCETMQVWAVNGFLSLYSVRLQDVVTGKTFGVNVMPRGG